jgi:hypothetical protein
MTAQTVTRRTTNIAALHAYPGFFHTRPIVIVGTVALKDDELRVSDGNESIHLIFKGSAPNGLDEIRGELWDIGRMKPDDPRLTGYDLKAIFHINPDTPWPRAGEISAIIASSVTPAAPPQTPTIRALVLDPSRYLDQKVTISGQFGGRNLLGDLPDAPGKSRYDFVLRSADAAIWVVNMRPKGKDAGKDFELSVDARIDTGRWLQVRGTLQQGRGLLWLDAEAGSLAMVKPPTDDHTDDAEPVHVQAGPPPEVVFSAPTQDETDVSLGAVVRIQFSRDLDAASIKNHVRVSYLAEQSIERGEPATPQAEFTTHYLPANRVLELKFAKPLERFRTVKVELLEGILGTDQQALQPWTLTFAVGGS